MIQLAINVDFSSKVVVVTAAKADIPAVNFEKITKLCLDARKAITE